MDEILLAQRKCEILIRLDELEKHDIPKLLENIGRIRQDLFNVETPEQAKEFDETHDPEEGLIHIRLF